MRKNQSYKPVPPEVLKAFGFRRIRKASKHTRHFTHYSQTLDMFYSAEIHTIAQFAKNYTYAVSHRLVDNIRSRTLDLCPQIN